MIAPRWRSTSMGDTNSFHGPEGTVWDERPVDCILRCREVENGVCQQVPRGEGAKLAKESRVIQKIRLRSPKYLMCWHG